MFEIFKKKEVAPEPRVVTCPEEYIPELLRLWDEYSDKDGNGSVERYNFWKFAENACPGIKDGDWNFLDGVRPKFKEKI